MPQIISVVSVSPDDLTRVIDAAQVDAVINTDSDGARTAQFFVVPRKGSGFIIFSVVNLEAPATAGSSSVFNTDYLEGLQKAALTASEQ